MFHRPSRHAGATAARVLKQIDPRVAVTLVEANGTFTACPFSNLRVAGVRRAGNIPEVAGARHDDGKPGG